MKHSGLIIVFALCVGCNEPQDTGGRNVNVLDNSDSRTAATMATPNEASTNCQTHETCPMGYICRANATGQKKMCFSNASDRTTGQGRRGSISGHERGHESGRPTGDERGMRQWAL